MTYSGKKYRSTAWLLPYGLLPVLHQELATACSGPERGHRKALFNALHLALGSSQGTRRIAPCTRLKAQGTRRIAQGTLHKAQGTRHCTRGAILQQFILNCSFCGSSCLDVFVFCEDLVLSFSVYLFQFCEAFAYLQ